jgi:tripartite-type tricarboxylate transporter receptor subunit TctC
MNLKHDPDLVRRRLLAAAAAVPAAALLTRQALAQAGFPAKPIRLVVPSAAGGTPDAICRLVAQEIARGLGQSIIIDNKPGAAAVIGMVEVQKAAPDGHTIGYANVGSLSINRSLIRNLPYDPDKDFVPIGLMGHVQSALVVRKDLPVNSVKELIAFAKANPGKLSMGSGGNGTTGHLGGELFKAMAGVFMVHVPYRGAPQATQDLMSGVIDLMFDNLSSIGTHIRGGRVRALAVTGAKRSPFFPELPTVAEAGLPGFSTVAWGGLVAPTGTPPDIVAKLNSELNRAMLQPAMTPRLDALAWETQTGTPGLLFELARKEALHWADVVKRSGATAT